MDTPFIAFLDITKIFGKNVILDNLELEIPYGEIFGIIGKSGSGKTTLLSILVGFLNPERGKVFFQGLELRDNYNKVMEQFGFTAQEGSFYPKLTVKENLEYFGTMYNLSSASIKNRIPELLRLVNLQDDKDKLASELSSGMQKRLDIACAIIHNPKVLILDEPTEDLDPGLRREILRLLKKINKEKKVTIVITSHLLEEIEQICTRLAILHNKKILISGTVNELKDSYSKNQKIIIETYSGKYPGLVKILRENKDVERFVESGNRLFVYSPKAESVLRILLKELEDRNEKILDVDLKKPSLTEVFQSLTKDVQINRSNKEKS
ncbi:ABC transporter ATP-binding protein [Candidatus Woesearchaeota archaeon]|nr:ABC transporter ATP-binding protein [Candidatus Woesearchaeota archaeon]